MFRVTVLQDGDSVVYRLEGELAGESVESLRESWNGVADSGNGFHIVDLNGVVRIDAAGLQLLSMMNLAGVRFVARAPYTRGLLAEFGARTYDELPRRRPRTGNA